MGWFPFRKKKKTNEEPFEQMTVDEALKKYTVDEEGTKDKVLKLASDACDQIAEVKRALAEAREEYDAVTEYLSDIQRIELIDEKERQPIEEAAWELVDIMENQKKIKPQEKKITDLQYENLLMFEEDIKRELPKLKEQEKYQQLVKEDLRQLEGEKGVQNYEKHEALSKKDFLKKLSIGSLIMMFGIFIMLFMFEHYTEADLTGPFFLSGVLAMALIFYVVVAERKTIYRQKMAEKRLNRVIVLINKTKIKYVNCTAAIDYAYEKYHVNSCKDLEFQYMEFVKAKERMELFEKSNEELRAAQLKLTHELGKYEIEDADVWCYQAKAIVDKKEMVEVRHRLNVRRQKLRERIDYNSKQLELSMNSLMGLRSRHAEYDQEIRAMI